MVANDLLGLFFWGFLLAYGAVMCPIAAPLHMPFEQLVPGAMAVIEGLRLHGAAQNQ